MIELRGDEALAVFRSPRQAIRAAVELQARFLQETTAAPELPLPVGIGLDAGEAVPVEDGFRGGALNTRGAAVRRGRPGEILGQPERRAPRRAVEGVTLRRPRGAAPERTRGSRHVLAIASGGVDVAERMRALASRRPARRVARGDDAVPRPRAARGGRGSRPDPARRAEAARRPRTSPRSARTSSCRPRP